MVVMGSDLWECMPSPPRLGLWLQDHLGIVIAGGGRERERESRMRDWITLAGATTSCPPLLPSVGHPPLLACHAYALGPFADAVWEWGAVAVGRVSGMREWGIVMGHCVG